MVQCSCHQALGSSLVDQRVSFFALFELIYHVRCNSIKRWNYLSRSPTIWWHFQGKKVLSYEFFSAVVCTIMSSATLGYCWRGLSILLFSFINQVDFSCQKWAIFLCNKQNNTWLFSDIKISLLVFVLEFCGFPNCLDRGKCRKLLYAAQSNSGNCSV